MKKIRLALTALLFNLIFTINLGAAPEHSAYTSEELGFGVEFPHDWQHDFWLQKGDLKKYPAYAFGNISDKNLRLEFIFIKKHNLKSSLDFFSKIYSREELNINNAKVTRVNAAVFAEEKNYMVISYLKLKNDVTLQVDGYLPEKSFFKRDEKYKKLIEVMNSLKKL